MQVVGQYLQSEATKRPTPRECDLFGRSAYNRYYYAVFLSVREMLSTFDPAWARASHSSFPQLLNGQVRAAISQGRVRASRTRDQQLEKDCYTAMTALRDLASLIVSSAATRVVADYSPAIVVDFNSGNNFSLAGVSIDEARRWPPKADALVTKIGSVWTQLYA